LYPKLVPLSALPQERSVQRRLKRQFAFFYVISDT